MATVSGQRIRIATADDLARVIPVVNAAFAIETFIQGPRTNENQMAEMMQTGAFLVLQDETGSVLASVFVELRGDRGYFGMLAVDPSRQGKGVGRAMVEAAESHCRRQGCVAMDISVLSLRPELVPFYNKLGYVETAREPFHASHLVKDGFECLSIVMSKTLSGKMKAEG
jgi:GNAT superfamily N-acetyltransferase